MEAAATAHPIQFTTTIGRLNYLMNTHYLEVPAEVIQAFGTLKIRLWCTVNGTVKWQCGLMALGQGRAYITVSTVRLKKLNAREGSQVHVALEPDHSEYGAEMPEELAELLRQDEEGRCRFEVLTAGMKRYIIQYVGAVKSSQLRIDRAILLIENLKRQPKGAKVHFRALLGLS